MSTATGITVVTENIRKKLLYVCKCINNLFYFLERFLNHFVQSGMVIVIWREKCDHFYSF